MSATTIHFVRHGKVYNPDHLLNSPQTNTISAVYSSPLDRTRETADAILDALNPVREARGEAPLMLTADERVIEAGNEFRGKRIGHGEGALWKNGNWKLVTNLYKPSWGESYQHIAQRMDDFARENRLWWSATNRRFSVIAIIWRPATPSTGCSCGTRRSPP